mgnify:CR=1 FL=1
MKNQLLTELTNRLIDKELTTDEELVLNDLLKDPDNKKYFESMVKTIRTLDSYKLPEQYIDIKNQLINKISQRRKENIMDKIIESLSGVFDGSKYGYAVSFALGGLIVGLIFLIQPASYQIDDTFLKGVMASPDYDKTYHLEEQSFSGAVNVKYSQDMVLIDVNLKTNENIDCELNYDKHRFALYGVKSLSHTDGSRFASHGNSVRLSNLKSNQYLVFLRDLQKNNSKVHVSFYNGSMIMANLTIDITK